MFKIDNFNTFCKFLELSSETTFNINLRKLLSQYGEISVMVRRI